MLSTGLADSTLLDMARISERWPKKTRDESLGYAYYRDAGSDIEIATKLLRAAKERGWSRDQVRKARRLVEKYLEEGGDDNDGGGLQDPISEIICSR